MLSSAAVAVAQMVVTETVHTASVQTSIWTLVPMLAAPSVEMRNLRGRSANRFQGPIGGVRKAS